MLLGESLAGGYLLAEAGSAGVATDHGDHSSLIYQDEGEPEKN